NIVCDGPFTQIYNRPSPAAGRPRCPRWAMRPRSSGPPDQCLDRSSAPIATSKIWTVIDKMRTKANANSYNNKDPGSVGQAVSS
ncbi:hypothetical protein ACLOJK_006617, partial [Asimina triloba]